MKFIKSSYKKTQSSFMKIGLVGNGFVGRATRQLECGGVDMLVYDREPSLCVPEGLSLGGLLECDIVFISVPTPMREDGSCHLDSVVGVVKHMKNAGYSGYIVVRSTVPVGTCDDLGVYFMPEFLTERNHLRDFEQTENWVVGLRRGSGDDGPFRELMLKLFQRACDSGKIAHKNVCFIPNKEAEMVKLFRNCALATKVSFCNEMYRFCEAHKVDYETVRRVACYDHRIHASHTEVPGPDGGFGFGGTCFPKDMSSVCYEMGKVGLEPYVMRAAIHRNNNIDRPKQEWKDNHGRSVV